MIFKDLELPKELSKKKKLDLYKAWIVEPLEKGSDERVLDVDVSAERYGLTENSAIAYALEKHFKEMDPNIIVDNLMNILSNKILVVIKITLFQEVMNEEILLPPENVGSWNYDVDYDKETLQLNATVHHRISDSHITNYRVNSVSINTTTSGHFIIDDISLDEQVVNTAITGERK